ncbi:MBL fold metallo-hydrolase [Peptostreptococcus porci]|uniref:MBL fold metallo-hydrolase n=1 Tax=Peptostreptococcus porci TaxID=2652282 RepID=UPI0023F33BF8|nr:MBL fold metallo-hydrolase [Peptostreptococcus porci]MDD7184001.1 MBL fold metallo-hydrolase [Peptostreptococcus porci]MDY4129364.1 MBL fold metallo-hydrolase [Peptostreptococcus porci]MDY4561793.1 MBL fold metallo-hydrolase [Peptostreptococcus porci]MDY5435762.1 MBL fold metallo-hydrolase [Peptostreptococcus porci]
MKLEVIVDSMMQENTYIYYDENTLEAVVIDPALCFDKQKDFIKKHNLAVKYIMLTHSHADHIGDVLELKKLTDAKIVANINEKEMLNDASKNLSNQFFPYPVEIEADIYVSDREKLKMGEHTFSFFDTPGHTEGGMCIRCGMEMFTGDTLFMGSIGRTDLYGGDYNQMLKSLKKLSKMENDLVIYPGHGPASTIGREKNSNYYMKLVI